MFGVLDQEEGDDGSTGTTHETVVNIGVASDSVLENHGVISSRVPDVVRPEPEDVSMDDIPSRGYTANKSKAQRVSIPPLSPSLSTVSDEEEVNHLLLLHEDSAPSSPSVPFAPLLVAPALHGDTSSHDILAVSRPTTAIAKTNPSSTRAEGFETEIESEIEPRQVLVQASSSDPSQSIDLTHTVSMPRSGAAPALISLPLENPIEFHMSAPGVVGAAANDEGADQEAVSSVVNDAPEPFTEAQVQFIENLIREEVDRCVEILAPAPASIESSSKRDIGEVDSPAVSDTG